MRERKLLGKKTVMSDTVIKFMPKTIFVCVTRAYEWKIKGVRQDTPPEDMARGYWLVNVAKANQCEVLAAVEHGKVTGVWKIDQSKGWQNVRFGEIPTKGAQGIDPRRKYCEVINELKDCPINGKPIAIIDGVWRMYGPVRYNF